MTSPQIAGSAAMLPVSPAGPAPVSCHVSAPGARHRRSHVEPQRIGFARHAPRALGLRQRLGVAGIERHAVGVARPTALGVAPGHHHGNLGAAFEARIDEAQGVEPGKRRAVIVGVFGLPPHRPLPCDAEPGKVGIDRGLVLRPAARGIDILDAQQQPPARRPRHVGIDQRRQRVAEVQIAVGRRREAENGWHLLRFLGLTLRDARCARSSG